ncbi:MAG TPA: hypothetical protein ENL40_00265 [Thermococcus litoralis]|uniref:Uncharacterized protein n=1 Tax=Thermococcus litoralis TaxID=2265 RepID=A0A7C5P5K1_THELI|nr:hypothetical protein [Thermococcus litoralis]
MKRRKWTFYEGFDNNRLYFEPVEIQAAGRGAELFSLPLEEGALEKAKALATAYEDGVISWHDLTYGLRGTDPGAVDKIAAIMES